MGVCYMSPNREEKENQALCRKIGVALYPQALVLWGNSNYNPLMGGQQSRAISIQEVPGVH